MLGGCSGVFWGDEWGCLRGCVGVVFARISIDFQYFEVVKNNKICESTEFSRFWAPALAAFSALT